MAFEQKEGAIAVFVNDRKERDTQPDWTGTLKLNGKLYRVALWDKKSKSGTSYMGGEVKVQE